MRTSLPVGLLLAATLVGLTACAPASDRAAMESYLRTAEPIAQDLSETGSKFETLMNVQKDALNWTDAEKTELATILASMQALQKQAEELTPPAEIADIHPLLPQAIGEMAASIQIMKDIAADPTTATDEKVKTAMAKTQSGGELAQKYVTQMEQLLKDKYPDLLGN